MKEDKGWFARLSSEDKELIMIMLMIIVVCILFFLIIEFKSEEGKCLTNPITYGISKLEKENGGEIYCTCNLNKPNSPTMFITSDGISFEEP